MRRRIHRFLKSELLESRRPLAADLAALDVNDDMSITALDALIIIDRINQQSSGQATTAEAEAMEQIDCDTNNDGVVSPVDVLNVVNQINSGVVEVPDAPIDSTTSETVDTPSTDVGDESQVVPTPDDGVTVTSPDDSADDTSSDDTTSEDDSSDSNDSSDPSTPVDESDSTDDDDVVSDPTDGSDDEADDDTDSDDTTDDTTDDDDDSSTDEGSECDHAGDSGARRVLVIGRGHGRGDVFAHLDANGDGALSSDEVPAALWERLVAADADGNESVTSDELLAYREAQRVAAVEAFFAQLDRDDSGAITSADVSRLTWRFLSRADADSNGEITIDELLAVPLPGRLVIRAH